MALIPNLTIALLIFNRGTISATTAIATNGRYLLISISIFRDIFKDAIRYHAICAPQTSPYGNLQSFCF